MGGVRALLLLVDDEPDILDTLQRLVEVVMPDVGVVTAGSGAEALRALERGRVDLVLSDYKMPGMDGLELLSAVQRRHPGIRRVLLTAFQAEEVQAQARGHGVESAVDALLPKAGDPAELLDRLDRLLPPPR